jgi:hypothetical protein
MKIGETKFRPAIEARGNSVVSAYNMEKEELLH